MTTKQDIRKAMATRRRALDPHWIEAASAQVIGHFVSLDAFQTAATVGLYLAIRGEINLDPLFEACWQSGKQTCIPVYDRAAGCYAMAEISTLADCETGPHGIREPRFPRPCPMAQIDLMAVPGVAFDRQGGRLGRGGGYYDRLLADFGGIAAAVAFDFQLIPAIPTEPHDRPVNLIVTESQRVNV